MHIPGAATLFVKFDPRCVTLMYCSLTFYKLIFGQIQREFVSLLNNHQIVKQICHFCSLSCLFRCSTEDGCDELRIASSADYEQNKHVFSGPSSRWIDLEIPGL